MHRQGFRGVGPFLLAGLWIASAAGAQPIVHDCTASAAHAPPFVWEVRAVTSHTGYCGILNPSCTRAVSRFDYTTEFPEGGYAAGPPVISWDRHIQFDTWEAAITFATSRGAIMPNAAVLRNTLTAGWNSSFLIESARSDVELRAWVRGGPGTPYAGTTLVAGSWLAARHGIGGSLYASGETQSFAGPTSGSCAIEQSVAFEGVSTSATREFLDHPGVVYSQVRFEGPGGWLSSANTIGLSVQSALSCLIACPPNFFSGIGDLSAGVRLWRPGGQPPVAGIVGQIDPATFAVTLRSSSHDPDEGDCCNAGILAYLWTINGRLAVTTCEEWTVIPLPLGTNEAMQIVVELTVIDRDGQTDSAAEVIDLINGSGAAPIPVSTSPGEKLIGAGHQIPGATGYQLLKSGSVVQDADLPVFALTSLRVSDSGLYEVVGLVDGVAVPAGSMLLTVGTSCPADYNSDGAVNSSDISAYLTSWLASVHGGVLDADFNGDGLVNSGDISAFITTWLEAVQNGC